MKPAHEGNKFSSLLKISRGPLRALPVTHAMRDALKDPAAPQIGERLRSAPGKKASRA
jgi:hypothetical protein